MNRRIGFALSIVILISLCALFSLAGTITLQARAQSNLAIQISGPTYAAVDSSSEFVLTLTGGPAEDAVEGWWEYEAYLEMENRSGSPMVEPAVGNSTANVFRFSVTAPSVEQRITLVIEAKSSGDGDSVTSSREYIINVVEPVRISTSVTNSGVVHVYDVPIVFYADGVEIGRVHVDIGPAETKDVIYNWTRYLSEEYTITVKVDPEGLFMDVDTTDNIASKNVYIGERTNIYTWIYGAVLIVFGAVTVMIIMNSRRPKRAGSPWKKKV